MARQDPQCKFTNLAHLLNEGFLTQCFRELRESAAPGVDGRTWEEYAENLEENIGDLVRRLCTLAGYAEEPRREPLPPGEVARSALDNTLAGDRLGWRPKVSLDDGLARTLDSFRGQAG
jgi:nucleoside-diphosphate-sugar epimerase